MDALFLIAVVELIFFSLLALCFDSKVKVLGILIIGIVISWCIGVYRAEIFTELAVQEFLNGARENYPSDGASNIFSLYFGWAPGLLYSSLLFGTGKVIQKLVTGRKANENR